VVDNFCKKKQHTLPEGESRESYPPPAQKVLQQRVFRGQKKLPPSYPPLIHQVIHHLSTTQQNLMRAPAGAIEAKIKSYPPKKAPPIIIIFIYIYIYY